jgi:hypothetical protein
MWLVTVVYYVKKNQGGGKKCYYKETRDTREKKSY